MNRAQWRSRRAARGVVNVFSCQVSSQQLAQVSADQRCCIPAKETCASLVDAGEVAFHVARINDVGGLLNDLPVMLFNAVTLGQSRHLNEKLFITKRYVEIIVSTGG